MFTGLIEALGTIEELRRGGEQASITVASALATDELKLGESIAVNGACLTVTAFGSGRFRADVSPETLERTTLGTLTRGARVNLERALRLSDRLGGHLVSGHVDGTARIVGRNRQGNSWCFTFELAAELAGLLVAKGSVAVDGISLTVNAVDTACFSVMVIPHTLEQTTLALRQVGEAVNVETDLLGKYVARLLGVASVPPGGVTRDLLARNGFL